MKKNVNLISAHIRYLMWIVYLIRDTQYYKNTQWKETGIEDSMSCRVPKVMIRT